MNARELYELYRNAHGNERGQRPDSFDSLFPIDRMVWVRLAEEVNERQIEEISDAGG